MSRVRDAVVVGGGPAGLYFAAAAAGRGLDVTVVEKGEGPLDKACGEGLLPAGRRALEDLGALELLDKGEASPIREILLLRFGRAGGGVSPAGGGRDRDTADRPVGRRSAKGPWRRARRCSWARK